MINSLQMKTLIKETLVKMGDRYYSDEAMMLIYNTGLVESKYKYIMQKGGNNIARGFFQCEPWVAVSVCNDYLQYRTPLMSKIAKACHLDLKYFLNPTREDWKDILTTNITAQIIFCRIHYWRVPKPLPKTLIQQAIYWKAFYNTEDGAGTTEHFMEIIGD
tara:strand:- start:262 stop:744 length:483 start_codon:yes stop_codon:yes gene_type:complete